MLLIGVFAAICVAGAALWAIDKKARTADMGFIGCCLFWVFLVVTCFSLIMLGANRLCVRSEIVGLEAARQTVTEARTAGISEFELAALQASILGYNTSLAAMKYWQKSVWIGAFNPAWIQDIEPIR